MVQPDSLISVLFSAQDQNMFCCDSRTSGRLQFLALDMCRIIRSSTWEHYHHH